MNRSRPVTASNFHASAGQTRASISSTGIEPTIIGDMKVYSGVFEGIDRKTLMDAANSIVEKSSSMCAFAVDDEKLTLIVAANPDLGIDCTMVLNDVLKSVSGKGGGSRSFATGGACARGEGCRLVSEAVQRASAGRQK